MAHIGLTPGQTFDPSALGDDTLASLNGVPAEAMSAIQRYIVSGARVTNGWAMNTDTMGVYGNFYLKRAAISVAGLGANQPEDAFYPLQVSDADGEPANGSHNYVLHFDAGQLPPVAAFWSVTMYDAEGFQIPNPIDRYALGDRDVLDFNSDGSLDVYVQASTPGPDREANWLPAPTGPFGLCMRLYAPAPDSLNGQWIPPAVRKV